MSENKKKELVKTILDELIDNTESMDTISILRDLAEESLNNRTEEQLEEWLSNWRDEENEGWGHCTDSSDTRFVGRTAFRPQGGQPP
jgi:hypothetical protein